MVAAAKPKRTQLPRLSLSHRLQIETLYRQADVAPCEIARQLSIRPERVHAYVKQCGWAAERRAKLAESSALVRARTEAHLAELIPAIALKTEELTVRSLEQATHVLDKRGEDYAKELNQLSGAARNFFGIHRTARGLDARDGGVSGPSISIANFVVHAKMPSAAPTARAEPINVTPAIAIS